MARKRVTRREFLGITTGSLAGATSLSGIPNISVAQQSAEQWPQFGYDHQNSGYGPENTGPEGEITQQSRFDVAGSASSPTIVDGTIYIGSSLGGSLEDVGVYALDAEDGTQQWSFQTGDFVESPPTVVNDTVYVGSSDNFVYALDPSDGTEEWSFEAGDEIISSPTVVDRTVYVGSSDNTIYALDGDDGTEQWSFETGDSVYSSPAVVNQTVYAGSSDTFVYALDASDGTKKWSFETGGQIGSDPAVVNDTVYIGSSDTFVYALDAADGTERWSFEVGDEVTSSPAVADGTVYTGSRGNNVYALNAADGMEEWSFQTDDIVNSSPAVVDGSVFVGDLNGFVYALNAADGTEQWSLRIPSSIQSSPVVLNGTVYIGSGNIFALAGEGGNTSTSTSGPADTQTAGNDDETQNTIPILPMALGALGLGGVGAWLYRQGGSDTGGGKPSGGDSADGTAGSAPIGKFSSDDTSTSGRSSSSGQTSTVTSGTPSNSSDSDPKQSTDSRLREAVNKSLSEGDDLRNEASDYRDTGEYDRALQTLNEAQEAYESVLGTASKRDVIDTDKIEQKLAAVEKARQTVHRQQLQEEVDSLKSDFDHAKKIADDGDFEEAQKRLAGHETRLASAKETAIQHNLNDLREEITVVEQRHEERIKELTERAQSHPVPDRIPRAPNVSVNCEEFIDEEPIGGGGNADVSKAILPTSDGDVILAIKRPRMAGTLHTDAVERMLDEAETWDKLDDHDHIVGVVDYGSEPIPWIAMEYMDAGHLGKRSGELEIQQALWTAIAVAKGVRHAHRRGVAHLDLKPENVLFRSVKKKWDVPKVADWGLSKHLLNHSKSVEGVSPQYAAPEQFDEDFGSADDITDIYQLGAVFYELFTGRPPFDGKPAKAMHKVLHKQPTPPSEIADLPVELDKILLTALAKEKDDRYDNVAYLRDKLQKLYHEW